MMRPAARAVNSGSHEAPAKMVLLLHFELISRPTDADAAAVAVASKTKRLKKASFNAGPEN